MKNISLISLLLIFTVILSVGCIHIHADEIISETPTEVLYTPEEQAILDKIDELSMAKARAYHYKKMYNVSDGDENPIYKQFVNEIDSIRKELTELGAKPTAEQLSALKFDEPVKVNGVLIDDFAEFEAEYGNVYDLWGFEKTVEASYGTYYTYDLHIQDYAGGEILAASVSQNGRAGWDLYAEGSTVGDLISSEINSASFDRIVESEITDLGNSNKVTDAFSAIKSLFNIVNGIDSDDPITVSGNSKSYTILCDTVSTVHFVFVRDFATKEWRHSLTTNSVNVIETHKWYYVISQNGKGIIVSSGDDGYVYEKALIPDDFNYRLTNAITAYRLDKNLYTDIITGYTLVVKEGTADLEGEEIFTLDITCPRDQFDLFRYEEHRNN